MATNLSKSHFFDAGKNPPRQRVVRVEDGTRRIEKIPNGRVERFVDKQGNVVWLQIVPPGMPLIQREMDARRGEIRRSDGGWFEYAQCPLNTGALSPAQFPFELQRPCVHHNGPGACEHVKHEMTTRREKHATETRLRHDAMRRKEIEKQRLAERAAAAQEELNQNIKRLVERVAGDNAEPTPATSPSATSSRPSSRSNGGRRGGGDDAGE